MSSMDASVSSFFGFLNEFRLVQIGLSSLNFNSVKMTYNGFDLCHIIRLLEEQQHLVDRLKIGPAVFCAALALLCKIRDHVLFARHVWHGLLSPATFCQQYTISHE